MENKYLTAQRTINVPQKPQVPVAQQVMKKQQTLCFGMGANATQNQGWFKAPKKKGFFSENKNNQPIFNTDVLSEPVTKGELIGCAALVSGAVLIHRKNRY